MSVPTDHDAMVRQMELEMGIHHKDGVPWADAPLPPRWHRCTPQTMGRGVLRCACGAIAPTFGPWMEKNSRRGPWWRFGRDA